MDNDDEQLSASFRRSAAALLAAADPNIAHRLIHLSFPQPPGPLPLHCPRCASPALITRSTTLRSNSTKTTGTRRARAQNTKQSRKTNKHRLLVRQCVLCHYEHKQALTDSHGNSDGDNARHPSPPVPDVLANNAPTKPSTNLPSASTPPLCLSNLTSEHGTSLPKRPLGAVQNGSATQARADVVASLPSKRAKKKAGLSAMLDRSKQQQREKEKQAENAASALGLASFLSAL